jgi:oligopeptide/dipeptide ABC transporter ATP-binding protein
MSTACPLPQNTPTPDSFAPLLQIEDLIKHFPVYKGFFNRQTGSVQAVNHISLSIAKGETLGVVGESGCGKSTLGRCILQLIKPDKGHVYFKGQDLTQLNRKQLQPIRQSLQMIFQNPYSSLDPRMTVGDILTEPLWVHRIPSPRAYPAKVEALLDRVGLSVQSVNRYPHEFSGGQRQRIGIARALALEPELIVADEPVSALDVSVQAQILNLLDDLKKELNLTLFFIAHNLSVVEYISDRVAVMYLGEVVELAPTNMLYQQPLHPYTQALLSAIPLPNPEYTHPNRILLSGDLPSPANPPSGCRFSTRCPYVTEHCKTEPPQSVEYAAGHWAACHRIPEWLSQQTKIQT